MNRTKVTLSPGLGDPSRSLPFPLADHDFPVHAQARQLFSQSGRPPNYDFIDARRGSKAEVQPGIARGQVAAIGAYFIDLFQAPGNNFDPGAIGVAVRSRTNQLHIDPVAARLHDVPEQGGRAIEIGNENRQRTIIINIGDGQTSADPALSEGGTRSQTNLLKPPISQVME